MLLYFSFLHQLSMSFYCLLYPMRLDADVALCGACGTVLQEPLNKGDVIAIVFVYLCCVPFAEAVSADALIAKVVADNGKLFLYGALCDGEDSLIALDGVSQTVVFYVLSNHKGDSENSALACFLLHDFKPVSVAVSHNVAEPEPENIADSQTKVAFQHKRGGDALIGAAAAEAFLHSLYYFFVLLSGERLCSLVHHVLQ